MNFNRMTIRAATDGQFTVHKMKRSRCGGYATDMAAQRFSWTASSFAPRFTGTYAECCEFIANQGAQFMSEHGLPV